MELLEDGATMVRRYLDECAAYGHEPPPAFVAALVSSNHLQLTDGGAASQEPYDPLDNVRSLLRDVYTARQELTSRPLFEGDAPELRLSVREFVVEVAVVRQANAKAPQVVVVVRYTQTRHSVCVCVWGGVLLGSVHALAVSDPYRLTISHTHHPHYV